MELKEGEYDVVKYIQEYLIERVEKVATQGGQHYFSFFLMCSGIEFLGACLDEYPFHEDIKGRFKKAISKFFPKYLNIEKKLYYDLRCGLLHATLPKIKFELLQVDNEQGITKKMHLNKRNNRIILIQECFFEDYKQACLSCIGKINSGELSHNNDKLNRLLFKDNNL